MSFAILLFRFSQLLKFSGSSSFRSSLRNSLHASIYVALAISSTSCCSSSRSHGNYRAHSFGKMAQLRSGFRGHDGRRREVCHAAMAWRQQAWVMESIFPRTPSARWLHTRVLRHPQRCLARFASYDIHSGANDIHSGASYDIHSRSSHLRLAHQRAFRPG